MQADTSTPSIVPAVPDPYILIVGRLAGGDAETCFRRIGLRPCSIEAEGKAGAAGLAFRLHFGAVSARIDLASADALDEADPGHPATSSLAARLPADWRSAQQAWMLIPEEVDSGGPPDVRATYLREFFKMAVLLVDLLDASHIFWSPARLWSDAPQYRSAVAEMLSSGMPPVLHLVAFRRIEGPSSELVRTRGLALFGGQEIESPIPPGWTVAEMVKRLARLALDIILNGPVLDARGLRGLGPGEWVSLVPIPDGAGARKTVRVEFGSDR
ncbi:hypothetical protein [Sphingopyxis sp.]|uniref:hypothetical protein n=1 Tax=Sphingopyxis sp. TaxID=1908224 RepID=UPI0035AFC465